MMEFHPAWLLVVLAILAILGGPFLLAVVVMLVVLGERPRKREPIISEDGRWLWDGQQWVPNQPPGP